MHEDYRDLKDTLNELGYFEDDTGAPNLDGASCSDDLMKFWTWAQNCHPVITGRRLFPERPKGYVTATRDLGAYAANKATAMTAREAGSIRSAQCYETICDTIYADLPQWARW